MGFFNKYPYTDFHELNADFILNRIKNIENQITTIKEEIEAEIFTWFQEQIKPFEEELQSLVKEVEDLKEETEETLQAYDARIDQFVIDVNNALAQMRQDLVNSIQAVNDLTDLKIENNNIWLLNEITQNVGDLFQVQNPFTGETVSIQSMIDYLSMFHITDGIDYDTMATRGLTYNQFDALNITYTDLTLHGNTLYT